MKGFFIAGTDTDVGKTFVSSLIVQALKHLEIDPYYYKPVASGGTVDIDTVRKYGQMDEQTSACPIVFNTPCSPHLASELEGRPIDKDQMLEACQNIIENTAFPIIEGAGGTLVPLLRSGFDLDDLMLALDLSVILVTRTGVGTINHTLLTLEYMKMKGIRVAGIIFNGYECGPFEKDNIKLIKERSGIPVIGVIPKLENEPTVESMKELAEKTLVKNLKKLIKGETFFKNLF